MAVANVKDIVDAELEGRVRIYSYAKPVIGLIGSSIYQDKSMGGGNPRAKYWFDAEPGVAKAIYQSEDGGIFHGSNVSPSTKYLRSITAQGISAASVPCDIILSDYLIYYPTIDESIVGETPLDNTVTLPRYTDGEGVMIMPVVTAQAPGGGQCYFTYTNSQGVSGRVSRTITVASGTTGQVLAPTGDNATAPFVGLQEGDTGVRSVDSVTMVVGDGGLFSILLVKPLASLGLKELGAPHEKDLLIQGGSLPIIYDDAYLNVATMYGQGFPNGIRGDIKVIWD
jgi:hypothetical protein